MLFLLSLHAYADWGLLALRLAMFFIFWVHGSRKWSMWNAKPSPQTPAPMLSLMRLLSVCEPLGAIAILVGFLTQPAALGLGLVMIGAIYMKAKQWKVPFMSKDQTGWEFDLMILAACIALLLMGGGAFSIDRISLGL